MACLGNLSLWKGGGKAMMSSSLEPHTEILGNRQTTWTAYAHFSHAHIRSQAARGCSTDATPHSHAIVMAIHHQYRDVSAGARARHHGASGPRWHARIAPRGFDPKYILVFPLPVGLNEPSHIMKGI